MIISSEYSFTIPTVLENNTEPILITTEAKEPQIKDFILDVTKFSKKPKVNAIILSIQKSALSRNKPNFEKILKDIYTKDLGFLKKDMTLGL